MNQLDHILTELHFHPFLRLALREANLTEREALVLSLSLKGFSQREIAARLRTSRSRVCNYFEKIRLKAGPKVLFPPILL